MNTPASTCHFAPVFTDSSSTKEPRMPSQAHGFPPLPEGWVCEFETFERAGAQLFAHLFRPKVPTPGRAHRAAVILHGQGEHGGRYLHVPHYLGDTIDSFYALDNRGHGLSSGVRGHVRDFSEYVDDAATAIRRYTEFVRSLHGRVEMHLSAHSMGRLIALRVLQMHPDLELASVTVSAPMIELAFPVPKVKFLAAKMLNKIMPSLALPGEPLGDLVSRDPAVVEHYKADPLNHGLASPAFFMSYLATKDDLKVRAKTFRHPLLFLLPTADRIIAPAPTLEFFQDVEAPEKKKIVYDGLYHEVFNEPEKDRVFADAKDWIRAHAR